jgi:N-acetylneuraminic acid mutarotase
MEEKMHGRKLTVLQWSISAILFTVCFLPASISRADSGEWTWINGSDMILQPGTYGTKGVPAEDNMPGARYGSASWADSAGNFWFFAGYGLADTDTNDYRNDLWLYEPDNGDNGTWTWMSGSELAAQPGIYGTKGAPAADNVPGARYASSSWTDSAGNLWLFGGHGLDSTGTKEYLNDLWRYEPDNGDNGTWTWMSGSDLAAQPGTYGTKGVPAADNVPGARYGSASWTDSMGNLWLFGGFFGRGKNRNRYYLNDLWRYEPDNGDNGTWTWMSGSDLFDQRGIYGTKGVPSQDNVPGARQESFAWTDDNGTMWLFGGYGLDKNANWYYLNDLWRYDPDNNTWTWVNGSDKVGKKGKYGAKGMTAEENVPGARYDGVAWMDNIGNLWLFGGYGHGNSGRPGYLNDLWRYEPDNDLWTWISGSDRINKPGIYGTKGVPAADTTPGTRNGSVAWVDSTGDLLLFGGYGYDILKDIKGYLNDLWRYELPADTNMRIDTCSIKAGTADRFDDTITDRITFSGFMDAGEARLNAAMGGDIVVSLWTDRVPDPDATTFSFPINEDTFVKGIYKAPKEKGADKSDPVLLFSYDSKKGTMTFSARNVDLTGLYCPISLSIEIGGYFVETELDEDIVNGPKNPCPLPLMMGVRDSLDALKFKAKKGNKNDSDSFDISGTFTVDGTFDTAQPVDIILGPDTFSVPGSEFTQNKGSYSCKKFDSGNGIVTAAFDTAKAAFSIKITNTSLNGSGDVDFSLDIFGTVLPSVPVSLPEEF